MGMRIGDCIAKIDTTANTLTLVIFFSEPMPAEKVTLVSSAETLPLSIALVDPETGAHSPLRAADFTWNAIEGSLTITLTNTATSRPVVEGSWIRVEIKGAGWTTPPSGIFEHQHDAMFYARVKTGVSDLQSYPVLTEDLNVSNPYDPQGFEGHTEFTWTPRSYTVQTDPGALTGAQASIHTRAKDALDQSLPLLDALYALIPYLGDEDRETVQALVRTQLTALVSEFGVPGGPRVPRVDELFELLLGASGSLGLIRQRFGLERQYVTTVDDEQNLTNYLILVDYVIGLQQSWDRRD
jgi:hypothetical protein